MDRREGRFPWPRPSRSRTRARGCRDALHGPISLHGSVMRAAAAIQQASQVDALYQLETPGWLILRRNARRSGHAVLAELPKQGGAPDAEDLRRFLLASLAPREDGEHVLALDVGEASQGDGRTRRL